MSAVSSAIPEGSGARQWRLTAPLSRRHWDGDHVVFSPLSGNTHILDVVAGALIERLEAGAAAEGELGTLLASFLELPDDAGLSAEVARILGQLEELGLVEPAA